MTMGGNFGELSGIDDSTNLVINADGTGSMTFEGETVAFGWTYDGNNSISLKSTDANNTALQEAVSVTYEDGALMLTMEMDGEEATLIYTQDGNYAGAKQITMDGAKAITSESELIGKWNLVGLNMMGVSMYGDAESLASAFGGSDTSITFEQGGTATFSGQSATWKVDSNGATVTFEGLSGTADCPIMMLDGDLVIDASETLGGMEFIELFSK
jgi:hypothetical protein